MIRARLLRPRNSVREPDTSSQKTIEQSVYDISKPVAVLPYGLTSDRSDPKAETQSERGKVRIKLWNTKKF